MKCLLKCQLKDSESAFEANLTYENHIYWEINLDLKTLYIILLIVDLLLVNNIILKLFLYKL